MDEKALILRWIETWKRAGPELEAIRRRELEAVTDEEARAAAANLLSMPLSSDLPEHNSGLVEQQRWFMRLRVLALRDTAERLDQLEQMRSRIK